MLIKFEMSDAGVCFTPCPHGAQSHYGSTIMVNSAECGKCGHNYGLTNLGEIRCKGGE